MTVCRLSLFRDVWLSLVFLALAAGARAETETGTGRWSARPAWSPADETRLAEELHSLFQAKPPLAPSIPPDLSVSSVSVSKRAEATLLLREIRLRFDDLPPDTREQLAPLLLRPNSTYSTDYVKWGPVGSYTESTLSSDNLVVHYVSGPSTHASRATTAFAQEALAVLVETATTENTGLGWPYPPSDGGYTTRDNGGDGRYDVYLADIGGLAKPLFGYVAPEEYAPSPGSAATSYMVLDNDYAFSQYGVADPLDALRVTVAHEYNHSCQFALNFDDSENWFFESTATYLEDVVYDSINDYYRFLPGFYNFPDVSLRSNGYSSTEPALSSHPYGAAVWNHYLALRFGGELILNIWKDTATGGSSHPSLHQTMQSRLISEGTTLADEFGRFAAWNFLTGSRGDPQYFPEGAAWPEVKVALDETLASFPAGRTVPLANSPQPLAASCIVIDPLPQRGRIHFAFQGEGTTQWRLWKVARLHNTTEMNPVPLLPDGTTTVDVQESQRYTWIGFVASNVATTGSTTRSAFAYSATFEEILGTSDLWLLAP